VVTKPIWEKKNPKKKSKTLTASQKTAAKNRAKKAGRKVQDDDLQIACAEACPTHAIAFGDLNDSESRIAGKASDERSYHLLEEVGVQPNVYYMTKVRNLAADEA
jgi:molybdopterin-containing oxidoreductase family iron-sulfur binding subunit